MEPLAVLGTYALFYRGFNKDLFISSKPIMHTY